MSARNDIALCSVRASSCTHHAHCARAQLPANPARQAFVAPNRRGDECQYFTPIEAHNFTPAGSDAVQVERPLAEAGGAQSPGLGSSGCHSGGRPRA